MKIQFVLAGILALALSAPAFAYTAGSQCGLVDSWGEVEDASTTFDLSRSANRARSLPLVVQNQLLAGANYGQMNTGPGITDVVKAAQFFRENSEGSELYILKATVKGKRFSVISYFGGGNHTGYIFPWGSNVPLAQISDDDVQCL